MSKVYQVESALDKSDNSGEDYCVAGKWLSGFPASTNPGGPLLTPDALYVYDRVGNLVSTTTAVDGLPYAVGKSFDSLNRPTDETIAHDGTVLATKHMAYDSAGNRTLLEADAPTTGSVDLSIANTFDAENRVVSQTSVGQVTTHQYDQFGNLIRTTLPNGIVVDRTYDDANRLTMLRNLRGGTYTAMSFYEYTYDHMTNRLSMRTNFGPTAYSYDALDRLTGVDAPSYYDFSYSYDSAGNRLSSQKQYEGPTTSTYNSTNELTKTQGDIGQTTYTWDAAGNLATKINPDSSVAMYLFDSQNRLMSVQAPSGSVFHGYDATGERVLERSNGKDTWFVLDGLSVLMELNSIKKPTQVFVPGVSQTRLDLPTPFTQFPLHDGLGSVMQLTDDLGNLTQSYVYEPFGAMQDGAKDRLNRYRYVGLAHDDLTGLTYMNARWYDQNVGRFLGRDPLRGIPVFSQAVSFYSYVDNNPISYVDPSGMFRKKNRGECEQLAQEIQALKNRRAERESEQAEHGGDESEKGPTHRKSIEQLSNLIRDKEATYKVQCEDQEPTASAPVTEPVSAPSNSSGTGILGKIITIIIIITTPIGTPLPGPI